MKRAPLSTGLIGHLVRVGAIACALGVGSAAYAQPKDKPKDAQPKDTKPKDTKPKDTKPKDTKPKDGKPADPKDTESEEDKKKHADAEKLFSQGRELLGDPKKIDQACEVLGKSYALEPRGDVLLNLAECHRRQGKTATSWREFDEAIRYAEEVGFTEAIDVAKKYRDDLAAKLSKLKVDVKRPPHLEKPEDNLDVVLDGKPLPAEQWGVQLYVDPGLHTVHAEVAAPTPPAAGTTPPAVGTTPPDAGTAPPTGTTPPAATGTVDPATLPNQGYTFKTFDGSTQVKEDAGDATITVEIAEIAPPPKAEPPKPEPPKVEPPKPKPPPPPSRGVPVWPIIVGVGGLGLIGVSIGFGVDDLNAGKELDSKCGPTRQACPRSYDYTSARSRETTGFNVFFGTGIAGLAATTVGVVGLIVGATKKPDVAVVPWIGPNIAGFSVGGELR